VNANQLRNTDKSKVGDNGDVHWTLVEEIVGMGLRKEKIVIDERGGPDKSAAAPLTTP
jgi:hypothetical protein